MWAIIPHIHCNKDAAKHITFIWFSVCQLGSDAQYWLTHNVFISGKLLSLQMGKKGLKLYSKIINSCLGKEGFMSGSLPQPVCPYSPPLTPNWSRQTAVPPWELSSRKKGSFSFPLLNMLCVGLFSCDLGNQDICWIILRDRTQTTKKLMDVNDVYVTQSLSGHRQDVSIFLFLFICPQSYYYTDNTQHWTWRHRCHMALLKGTRILPQLSCLYTHTQRERQRESEWVCEGWEWAKKKKSPLVNIY